MKVFVDEDTGASIGRALRAVGVRARYVSRDGPIHPGTPDEIWIPWAGKEGSLVLSRNIGIVDAETQRALLMACKVGVVFLPQHLDPFSLLRLILKKWDWLETLDGSESRPFAWVIGTTGRARRLRLRPTPNDALARATLLASSAVQLPSDSTAGT